MKKFLDWLKHWRHELWKSLTGNDETTWGVHWVLVMAGSIIPAAIAAAIWGLSVGTVIGFAFSELWLLFMSGREVVDYFRHTLAGDEKREFVRDGIGDLVGPVVNHVLWWIALLALLMG